jgi:hypothetical protein
MANNSFSGAIRTILRQRSLYVAIAVWVLLSGMGLLMARGNPRLESQARVSSIALVLIVLMIGEVSFVARNRPVPDLGERAPERGIARQETAALWCYGFLVMVAGRIIGQHFFGEGIALHLNGSLVGATRVQSPTEVYTWAVYNGVLLALIPYVAFRLRRYSNQQLNLKSDNVSNDTVIIFVVLALSCALDFTGPNILHLTRHQQIVGGSLSFILHMIGTDLPIMIFVYAILLPRYFKLFSAMTAYLLGAASYPAMHIFESGTRYDSAAHSLASLTFVFLGLFPAGLMKSFLTFRTGNAWVHLWGFHAISPHVTVDTRLIVSDFRIR